MKLATKVLLLFGGEFSPSDIPGLTLWLDASFGTYQDSAMTTVAGNGDVVGGWKDKSANANHVIQAVTAAKPTLQTGVINNLPTVRGDGSDDYLQSAAGAIGSVSGFTIFVVAQFISFADNDSLIGISNGAYGATNEWCLIRYRDAVGGFNTAVRKAAPIDNADSLQVDTNAHIFTARWDASTTLIRVDGTETSVASVVTAPLALTQEIDVLAFDNGGTIGGEANADLAEVLIYSRALSISEYNSVEQYLISKYGISGGYSSGYSSGYG